MLPVAFVAGQPEPRCSKIFLGLARVTGGRWLGTSPDRQDVGRCCLLVSNSKGAQAAICSVLKLHGAGTDAQTQKE